jgi:AcrR family transcriptional regulator
MVESNGFSDKKNRIIEAAMLVFGKHPFHQVKIEQIAEKASVGKGTIYEYFRSKDELFLAMAEAASRIYFAEMVSSVKSGQNVKESLQSIFYYHLLFIEKHTDISRILLSERKLANQEFKKMFIRSRMQLERFITELVQKGIDSGEFRKLDPTIVAQVIMGTLTSLWAYVLLQEHSVIETKEVVEKILDFYLHGLKQESGS